MIGVKLEYGTDSRSSLRLILDVLTGEYALEDHADIELGVSALVPDNGASTVARFLPVLGRGMVLYLAHAVKLDGFAAPPLGHAAGDGRKGLRMVCGGILRLLRYNDHQFVNVHMALLRQLLDCKHARTSVLVPHGALVALAVRSRGAQVLLILYDL